MEQFKPGFMNPGRKIVKFCASSQTLRKIKPRFVTFANFCGANAFINNDFRMSK